MARLLCPYQESFPPQMWPTVPQPGYHTGKARRREAGLGQDKVSLPKRQAVSWAKLTRQSQSALLPGTGCEPPSSPVAPNLFPGSTGQVLGVTLVK